MRALGAGGSPRSWIGLAPLALLAAIAACVGLMVGIAPSPHEHAPGATAAALIFYVAVHTGIGLLFLTSNILRLGAGLISPLRSLDLRLTRLWIDYTAMTAVIALGLVLALPLL